MRALAVGTVALLLLAGCAGTRASSAPPSGAGDSNDHERLGFAGDAAGSQLRLAAVRPPSFRPGEASLSDQAAVVIADLLYDGLTEIDGSGREASLGPGLARSWQADREYRSWAFHLDPTSGVSADLVVDALSHLEVSPGSRLPTDRPSAALAAGMTAVVALDPTTVGIELERSNAGLPWVLSGLPFSVTGRHDEPTGDYEIVVDDPASLRLQRRSHGDGSPGPFADIEVVWVDDPSDAYGLWVDGTVDAAIVGPRSIGDAEQRAGGALGSMPAVRFYVLNPGSPELADLGQRTSLLGLVDAAALVTEGARGDLTPIDGLVPPSLAGYRRNACGTVCGGLQDGRAEAVEPAIPWPSDALLRVTYAGDGQAGMARALAHQLEAAGLPASPVEATARDLAMAIIEGSPDLFAFGWVAPAGSVDAVLPALLREDSPANVARFASAEVEQLLDEAAVTGDDDARWSLLARAHRLALAESKVLPVAASTGTLVMSPDLSGIAIRADGSIDLESLD